MNGDKVIQDRILEGIKVVELASILAGPLAGSFMSELGASVVKVENVNSSGDATRQWKMPCESADVNTSAYFASANTGKQSVLLDLKNEADYAEVLEMVKVADVVISNFQKETAESLKVTYTELQKVNEKLIFAQLVAYSYDNPKPGYDLIMQAESGFMSMNGTSDGETAKMPVALIDVIAGHQLKEAILLGLIRKQTLAIGSYCEVSLYKSAISALANQASNYLMNNHIPKPMGSLHPNIAPYGDYTTTKDGIKVILAIGSDKQFEKLGKTLNFAAGVMRRFMINKSRVEHREELMREIRSLVASQSFEEIRDKLEDSKIPFCRVQNLEEVFQNPLAIEMIINEEVDGVKSTKVSNIAFVIK